MGVEGVDVRLVEIGCVEVVGEEGELEVGWDEGVVQFNASMVGGDVGEARGWV